VTYVALLRGINVGGKNPVDMKRLKATFERAGMAGVITYINSGNVIFRHPSPDARALATTLERAIAADFGLEIKVLLCDGAAVIALAAALPDQWVNDAETKCDALFLWEDVDEPGLVERLPIRPGIDEIRYAPGALLWRAERQNLARSGILKLSRTDLYQRMTVRNCNTLRKLADLVRHVAAGAD